MNGRQSIWALVFGIRIQVWTPLVRTKIAIPLSACRQAALAGIRPRNKAAAK